MTLATLVGFIPFNATDEYDITRELLQGVLKQPFTASKDGIPILANIIVICLDFQVEELLDSYSLPQQWERARVTDVWNALYHYKVLARERLYKSVVELLDSHQGEHVDLTDNVMALIYETVGEISYIIENTAVRFNHKKRP
jgi:hypothetical protein